jgi:hypothetical protein
MSARFDNTVAYTAVSEISPAAVAMEALANSARTEVFRPLCRQFDITGEGTTFNIPNTPSITFAAVTEGTAPVEQAFDPLAVTCTPLLYGADVIVGLNAWKSAQISPEEMISNEVGEALAKSHDALAAVAYQSASSSTPDHLGIGTDGTKLNVTALKAAQALLSAVPAKKPYAWVVHNNQLGELLEDELFFNAAIKGSPVLTKGVQANGFYTGFLNVEVYECDQIVESSGRHSMMFSKGIGMAYVWKQLETPYSGGASELVTDIFYNSGARAYEVNSTYLGCMSTGKGTGTYAAAGTGVTTNNFLVDYIS